MDSDLDALIISAVAPHSINSKSMVLSKNKEIAIKFDNSRKQDAFLVFDGEKHTTITEKDIVTIKLSNRNVQIYSHKDIGQFAKVDSKIKSR